MFNVPPVRLPSQHPAAPIQVAPPESPPVHAGPDTPFTQALNRILNRTDAAALIRTLQAVFKDPDSFAIGGSVALGLHETFKVEVANPRQAHDLDLMVTANAMLALRECDPAAVPQLNLREFKMNCSKLTWKKYTPQALEIDLIEEHKRLIGLPVPQGARLFEDNMPLVIKTVNLAHLMSKRVGDASSDDCKLGQYASDLNKLQQLQALSPHKHRDVYKPPHNPFAQ